MYRKNSESQTKTLWQKISEENLTILSRYKDFLSPSMEKIHAIDIYGLFTIQADEDKEPGYSRIILDEYMLKWTSIKGNVYRNKINNLKTPICQKNLTIFFFRKLYFCFRNFQEIIIECNFEKLQHLSYSPDLAL